MPDAIRIETAVYAATVYNTWIFSIIIMISILILVIAMIC